jgi:CHAT domain-containing protein/tetratricopeptide (TPR) repeat protein
MNKNILTILLFFLYLSGFAQPNSQTLITEIDNLLIDSRFEEAIRKIDGATLTDLDITIQLANRKAEALIRMGRFEEASRLLIQTLDRTEGSKNRTLLSAVTQTNIGFLYLNQGRNDLALETLLGSSGTLQQLGNDLESAKAMAYLGLVYMSTGKYAQAEEQLQMALSTRQKKLSESHELVAATYNDLGMVYSQLDVDKSIDYYEKATAIYEKLHGKDHPKMAIANTNLGVVYRSLELYGDAVNYFEAALAIWEKIYPQPHPSKAFVLSNLGQTYSQMNDQNAALGYYQKALTMYVSSQGNKHPDVSNTYNLIGNVLVSQQKYDEGLINYQKALIANVSDFNSENIEVNPSGDNFYNGNQLLYSMMYKAQALEARHLGKTLKQKDLMLGLKTLQECDQLIDKLRQQATNESDKIALGAIANEVYADGVRISYLLSEVAFKKRKDYREQCFYFAEKSKSAVLLDAISETNAKSFAGVPDKLLEEEKTLKSSIALVAQKLAQKPSEQEEKQLRETAFRLNQNYQTFIQDLEKQYPEYFNLKYNSTSPSIAQIQNLIDRKTAILSYFIDDSKRGSARLYTYVISHGAFKITERALPDTYDRDITGLRNGLFYMSSEAYIGSARRLHKLLVPRIPSSIKELVVLPTGRMSVIPFEALLTKDIKDIETAYETLPYLVKRFGVRYEFSAGLLLQKKREGTANSVVTSALLCAPVSFPKKDNLNDLPGTELEVNTINTLFSGKNIPTQVLLREKATETALKSSQLKEYSLVHFATHGIVDESSPELSRIFLQTNTEAEDGNLFSGEIYNLQLNADLVTLSACQTGLGRISKGEGVIGLSRALVYAGAKNIIVSFWSVADESTAQLMTDFYRRLLEKPAIGYSENLREAKLNLMKGDNAAPYYWAPFILIGF